MHVQAPLAHYNLACITEVYGLDLSNMQYLRSWSNLRHNNRRVVRRQTEESKLKISRANKGKRLGRAPWNKGKKLHYIPGKREHSVQTLQKMSEAAKRRWSTMYYDAR
jgi:NUMOD3 motif